MFNEYLTALFMIFIAEMGDKTQILAMMFATKYRTSKVLVGIMIGSALNHSIAVLIGALLGKIIPIDLLQMIAGVAFIGFAIWTLVGGDEEEEEEENQKKVTSGIVVVAMAFFLGELGDKTQLTAITLSVDAMFPFVILLGTVSGMIVTSSIGIFLGRLIGNKMPENLIKIASSTIFLIFGVIKLMTATPDKYINPLTISLFVLVVALTLVLLLRAIVLSPKSSRETAYGKAAQALYDYAHGIEETVDEICLGIDICGQCNNEGCAIGFIRHLAKEIQDNAYHHDHEKMIKTIEYHREKFDQKKLIHMLENNMKYMKSLEKDVPGYEEVDIIRRVIEIMILGQEVSYTGDIEQYIKAFKSQGIEIHIDR